MDTKRQDWRLHRFRMREAAAVVLSRRSVELSMVACSEFWTVLLHLCARDLLSVGARCGLLHVSAGSMMLCCWLQLTFLPCGCCGAEEGPVSKRFQIIGMSSPMHSWANRFHIATTWTKHERRLGTTCSKPAKG